MSEWQGPFTGMEALLEGCVYVGVVAGVVATVAGWVLHRRSVRGRRLR
ncbi:hypothetical protein [Modestobacter versicolor]